MSINLKKAAKSVSVARRGVYAALKRMIVLVIAKTVTKHILHTKY